MQHEIGAEQPKAASEHDQVETVALDAFWDELCPAIRRTANDEAHFLPAIRAALSAARPMVLEEAAKLADEVNYGLACEIRALAKEG